jgi:hypothetical protein
MWLPENEVRSMVLDMESEFYKLAHDILSKPKNLYKMAAIGPKSGRLNIMGADGFVVVGKSLLYPLMKGPENKAYRMGFKCAGEMFGNLLKEFDEEIENLPPKKLLELGILLTRNLGWGDLEMIRIDTKKREMVIKAKRTLELKYKNAKHHMLTCGYLAGIASLSFKNDVEGRVTDVGKTSATFTFS